VGLAVCLGLWGQWTASAQDTFIVNDDTAPADDGCGTPDFETDDIQDAIDSSLVADGDRLIICEGIYVGDVTVAKSLTIEGREGADRADVRIEVSGFDAGDGLIVEANGVTVRHLTVDGSQPSAGIVSVVPDPGPGYDHLTLTDLEVTDWHDGVFLAYAQDTVIEESEFRDELGVVMRHGTRNVVRNNETRGPCRNGLNVDAEDQLLAEGNRLEGCQDAQIDISGDTQARILRNEIVPRPAGEGGGSGIRIKDVPAESLVQIGGSENDANTFSGDFGDPDYYVRLDCDAQSTVDATYNWWGSTNRTDIANRIFNDEDDMSVECAAPDDVRGAVVFHPWATGPAPTPTPTATPSPTATATGTGTPTPTPTPGATRTIELSPQGWHDLAWSGADATDPATALACISGDYSIAYAWEGPTAGFKRHVEGCAIPGICNMAPLNKYDTLLVNITAAGVTCEMPVAP
jgi:hypothetical protein